VSHILVEGYQETDEIVFVVLSVASLEEDTYGHVQHVLPATLEAMVRFRGSIVALESELLAQAGTIGKPGQVAGQQVKEILSSYIGGKPDIPG
jgi:nucleoporin NDC1